MNRLPKYPVALLLVALLQTGSLSGQAPSPPTSFPLENTLENLFPVTEGPCDLESARSFSNFRALLDYDADESAEAKVVVFGNHVVDLPGGEGRQVELAVVNVCDFTVNHRLIDQLDSGRRL